MKCETWIRENIGKKRSGFYRNEKGWQCAAKVNKEVPWTVNPAREGKHTLPAGHGEKEMVVFSAKVQREHSTGRRNFIPS